jgi:hypothetical protein
VSCFYFACVGDAIKACHTPFIECADSWGRGMSPCKQKVHTMNQEASIVIDEPLEEDFETIGDYHRLAAHHFQAAARHHLAAGDADDDGDEESSARHAYLAYRHQLNGVHFGEVATMESDALEDEFELEEPVPAE